jgi:hypothetical protein
LINTGTTSNYTGDGTSGIYLWGAQLEEASTVGEYVKTTTTRSGAPRFDHDPETGESLGLLVEESRTNLLLYSTNFDNSYWLQTNITTNSITAPDGTLTAATYEGTGAGQSVYNPTSATVTASTNYTYSIYVKLGTMSAGNYKFAVYDASNSSFVGVDLVPSVTPTTTSWTRVTYSFTTPSGCTELRVYPFRSSSSITSSTVHFWGAQVEAGAFPTSYIPTEGATVTRGVDVASISGTNFSSWYEQSEGTVFADSARYALGNSAGQYIVCEAGNSSFNNDDLIQLGSQYGSNNFQFLVNVGNVNEVALVEAGVVTQSKYVGAYKINDFAYTKNGASPATDTSGTTPTVSKFNIGSRPAFGNTGYLNGTIKHLTYWDARVANEKLQSVTS